MELYVIGTLTTTGLLALYEIAVYWGPLMVATVRAAFG
ncbi:hypothetical protein QF002_000982 [Paraburkholderia youngii]